MISPTVRVRVQPRDRSLVRDLFLHRFATRDQLVSLGYFGSVPRCNNRMARLVDAGWVKRVNRVNGLGVSQSLYTVGPAAYLWLPEALDADPQDVAQQCRPGCGPLLIEHSVRALDFRLRICKDAAAADFVVDEWRCELECRHSFRFRSPRSAKWRNVLVKPDGYFRLVRDGQALDCFVEIDLGHVALPRFARKLAAYRDYCSSGAFGEVYEADRFALLTVTVGERRLAHLASLEAFGNPHYLTTWHRLKEVSLCEAVWTTASGSGARVTDLLEGHR